MSDDQGDAEFDAGTAGQAPSGRDQGRAVLDELAALRVQIDRLAGDVRAQLTDALGGLDGDAVMAELAGLRRQLGTDRGTVVEQLQDHLADVASGDVVGALWDEVRGVRDAIDGVGAADTSTAEVMESLAALRAEVEGLGAALAASAEPTADPAVAGLRDDVRGLVDEVRALSDAVAAVERDVALPADGPGHHVDAVPDQLVEELATLRNQLAEGLVVEPSDALSTSLDVLRVEVDALNAALGEARNRPGPVEPPPPPRVELDVLADQVASLRDLVATEVDGLRQAVVAAADRTEQLVRSRDETPAGVAAADHGAGLDPAVVEELKDEIRAAGAIGDQVVDALREELAALRRRIAVKASEKVLDEEQLRQIADAVAARLEKG